MSDKPKQMLNTMPVPQVFRTKIETGIDYVKWLQNKRIFENKRAKMRETTKNKSIRHGG